MAEHEHLQTYGFQNLRKNEIYYKIKKTTNKQSCHVISQGSFS